MNTGVPTAVQTMKTPPSKHKLGHDRLKEKEKEKEGKAEMLQGSTRLMASRNLTSTQRERKMALQQDVDKLKKRLRHEENVHRALERAFTRPLGALPRLPPYLPPQMLELLAEVAVLEEEVVRLEEQVVNFRQGLYQEAIYIASSKKTVESNASDLYPCPSNAKKAADQSKSPSQCGSSETSVSSNDQTSPTQLCSELDRNGPSSNRMDNGKKPSRKPNSCSPLPEDRRGKENQLNANSPKVSKQSPQRRVPSFTRASNIQVECKGTHKQRAKDHSASDIAAADGFGCPNKISEDLLKCLVSVFSRMSSPSCADAEPEMVPSVSGFHENSEDTVFRDPYGICAEFGRRDVGPYKHFRSIDQDSVDPNLVIGSSFLIRKLRLLLKKLESVDLRGLRHQEKLAFWINIYNSCMMNSFLHHGIPATPQRVVALMQKAMINVGGHLLSAMTIEHFILRLPYNSKYAFSKGSKNDEMATRSILGLDWPEPLVTFALSCGSWSSPAVRVYTASQVESELETAKQDYLQAAIGISQANKLAIPKLLDWYLLDFAKDIESLMDWICLQLPSGLRNDAVKCIERGRRGVVPSQTIQVLPYKFSFRYLLAT